MAYKDKVSHIPIGCRLRRGEDPNLHNPARINGKDEALRRGVNVDAAMVAVPAVFPEAAGLPAQGEAFSVTVRYRPKFHLQ